MKILIVEDEVLIREGMSDYLMECGYEIFEAGDGQEALDLFHREAPDLVLLDIQLPILNGLEVLKTIRKTSSVPVLMLTAFHDEDYKLTAFGEMADGYLEKPFSLSLLKVRIEAIFKKLQPSSSPMELQVFLPKQWEIRCSKTSPVALPNKWLKNPLQPTLVEELRRKASVRP